MEKISIPAALIKATEDEFDCLLVLRNGFVFRFGGAAIQGEWAHLSRAALINPQFSRNTGTFVDTQADRFLDARVDIRIADISAIAEAPMGKDLAVETPTPDQPA